MGSSCYGAIDKYKIPQKQRFYDGDIDLNDQDKKWKSKSSKQFAGTNTNVDLQHQNQPIRGDIYNRFRPQKTLPQLRVNGNMHYTDAFQNIQYGINPYQLKNDGYARSKTDNPSRYLNSNPQNNNHANYLKSQNRNQNLNQNSVNYDIYELDEQQSNKPSFLKPNKSRQQSNKIKPTQSRIIG